MTKLDRLWETLEAVSDLAATDLEWRWRLGTDYGFAKAFLVSRGQTAGSYPCPAQGHHGHRHRIIHDGDGDYAGACEFCGESSHSQDDVCIYGFNATKLGKIVASAFGLQPADGDVPDVVKTYRVGTYVPRVGRRVPVFLTLQTRRKGFQGAADRIAAIETGPFILMAPTATLFQPESESILKRRNAYFVSLQEVLEVNGHRQIASAVTIEQALDGSKRRRARRGRPQLTATERRRYEKLWRGWEEVRGKAGMKMSEYCSQKGITPKQLESIGRQVRRARRSSSAV